MTATTQARTTATNSKENSMWTEKAAAMAHDAVNQLAGKGAVAETALRSKAEGSAEAIAAKKDAVQKQFDSSVAKARSMARENPLMAAGLAFAAGIVVTALLRGGKK